VVPSGARTRYIDGVRKPLLTLLVITSALLVTFGAAAQTGGPPEVQTNTALPAPANARLLCDEHVLATSAEIHWQLYALRRPPEEVVREYLQRTHTSAPRGADGRHLLVRMPNQLLHDVLPASEMASGPHCAQNVREGELTLVRVSVMHEFRRAP
jgi:hypothetical protein